MHKALGAKNKILIIDGFLPNSDYDDLNRATWGRCNNLVHS